MDPVLCLEQLREAFQIQDREAIAEKADAMLGWIEKDGFMPDDLVTLVQGLQVCDFRHRAKVFLRAIRSVAEMP